MNNPNVIKALAHQQAVLDEVRKRLQDVQVRTTATLNVVDQLHLQTSYLLQSLTQPQKENQQ